MSSQISFFYLNEFKSYISTGGYKSVKDGNTTGEGGVVGVWVGLIYIRTRPDVIKKVRLV